MANNKKIKVLKAANSWFMIAAMVVYIAMPILTLAPQTVTAATIGPNNGSTFANDTTVGSVNWSNHSRAQTSNNSRATASLNDNQVSSYLKATNFGFTIPDGATINGIQVDVERRAGTSSRIKDNSVRIVRGDSIGTENKAGTSFWGRSETYVSYGSAVDLWSETWTPADINATNFGFVFSAIKDATADSAINADVNHIRITVYYTEAPPVPNPELTQSCGLDIALVADTSGSISQAEMTQMKNALSAFATAFEGTPTVFSLTSFAAAANILNGFSMTPSQAATAISSLPTTGNGNTNWEDGLLKSWSTFNPRSNPDLIIFASDGNPTVRNGNSTNGFQQADLDAAITVANNIKTDGIRIIGIGIGSDLNVANMQVITGPNVDTGGVNVDVITTDFSTLASDLAALAVDLCGGTITAIKIIDADGILETAGDQTPGESWNFDVAGSQEVTDQTGYTQAVEVDQGTYDVSETQEQGYALIGASCTGSSGSNGTLLNTTISGIEVGDQDIVSCTFYNSFQCTDADSDGFCEDVDCDDTDPSIYPGATEMCNGVDDNCNQIIDEGFNVGDSCSAGFGICQASGQFVCTIDGLDTECNAAAGTPSEEVCDGQLDENCDGTVDENCDCTNGDERPCGDTPNQGICMQGTQTCESGAWGECVGAVYPATEICGNQIDEDCDGSDLTCPYLTINAYKIFCQLETDLPNWGNGDVITQITETTASDYVVQHPNCQLTSGWEFQWAYAGALNPGDNIEYAGSGWTTFGPTDSNGLATTEIGTLDGDRLWLREVIQGGYFPFSGDTSAPRDDVSAEIYCHQDVLNYDNYDRIDNPSLDNPNPYYCVAFNAPTAEPEPTGTVTACKYDDKNEDGVYQPFNGETGDTPLAWNITLWYYDAEGHPINSTSTTTDPVSGCVTFNDLSYGTYTVHEEHISDWVQTSPSPDGSPTIVISETNVNPTVTFLNYYQEQEEEPICGNETIEEGEQCDDGNTSNGDGCSANCTIEQCIFGSITTCSTGNLGICSAGTQTCNESGFWGDCVQNVQPTQEICGNGVDEDCNGSDATCHSRGGQFMPPAEPEGEVLGEATTTEACGLYLFQHIKYGADNDPAEVMKLQIFLNEFMGDSLTVNGIYDQETLNAVNEFQLACKEEVLRPWVLAGYLENENTPTGYVYLTTKRWINLLKCPSLNIPLPNLFPDLTGSSLGLEENNEEVLGEETVLEEESTTTVEEQPEEVSAPVEETVLEETGIPTTTEKEGSNWLTIIILIIALAVILGLAAWAYKKK